MSQPSFKINSVFLFPFLLFLCATAAAQTSTREGVYTEQQAVCRGALYLRSCVECHGITLAGGEAGPALVGGAFWQSGRISHWQRFTRSPHQPCR